MLIGRYEERRILTDIADSESSQFIVIYGRRRIGKTFLVRETFDYEFSFSHTALDKGNLSDQLFAFKESLEEYGIKNCPVPSNWLDAFSILKQCLRQRPEKKKIIFIDELPWLDTPRSKFVSALENFWNGWCTARKDIVLIVCGSATSWMVKKILRNKGGLFNRFNRTLFLEPFSLRECEELLISKGFSTSRKEIAEAYMIFGGSPYYWTLLDSRLSIAQNIDRLCFSQSGELSLEFKRLFASIFKSPDVHLRIIKTLGEHQLGLTREEISSETKIPNTGILTTLLEELAASGFIRQYVPLGRLKKGSFWQLIDAFTIFYYHFMVNCPINRRGIWEKGTDTPGRHAWEGLAFERLCLWHEEKIKSTLGIAGIISTTAGWRSRQKASGVQIDLIIDRKDGVINICEMKFSDYQFTITKTYAEELKHKISVFKEETQTRKAIHLTLITTYGLKRNEYSSIVQSQVTLEDLFK